MFQKSHKEKEKSIINLEIEKLFKNGFIVECDREKGDFNQHSSLQKRKDFETY